MPDLELLDCGGGRRLERFGAVVVDRPAPMALEPATRPPADWAKPDLRWSKSAWIRGAARDPWTVVAAGLTLECRPAAGGQVGVFPEHAATWAWLARATGMAAERLGRPPEVLSLFAYTGGATLACARAGGRVAHVDASKPAVAWARRNAELSDLAGAPVRWLIEDARAFVRRERRRGRVYDGIVLDPPTYGHGDGAWQIDADLPALLEDLAAIAGPRPSFVALSTHTPGYDADRLGALVRDAFGVIAEGEPLRLRARSGAVLALGALAKGWGHGDDPVSGAPAITSTKNPRIAAAVALRDRRARDAAGLTLVDGVRELSRAIDGGARVEEVFVDEAGLDPAATDLVTRARAAGATITPIGEAVLARLAYGDRAEGLVATVAIPHLALERLALPADPLVVVLEAVEKPGNLGAVLRSADAAGADAVLLADPRTDPFNPNAIRASLGTIFATRLAAGSSDEVRSALRRAGVRVLAARVDGSVPYTDADLTGGVALVMGSEADGLTDAWADDDITAIALPMHGIADSLNVSITAAVLLYEARRQRGAP